MLTKMHVHGFRCLVSTDVMFEPLTIMLGKNGVGKTTVLDVVQLIGKFARGGVERAFGPPPWSLGWQRTKGLGNIATTDFDLEVRTVAGNEYSYTLKLEEWDGSPKVREERLMRLSDHSVISSFERNRPPASGTILRPDGHTSDDSGLREVSSIFTSFESYEINPSYAERGNDPKTTYVGRNGFGVAGYLASLQESSPDTFKKLESYLKRFRPETQEIRIWGGDELYWGLLDKGQKYPFSAVHLSWGDRVLVGILCVLFSAPPNGTIAIEEIDRGFHSSRYSQIVELLMKAAYDGIAGNKTQIIVTTHSPSFVNKLSDLVENIRIVTRAYNGGTVVRPLQDVLRARLGTTEPDQPLGEVWEMGLLEDTISEIMA